MSPARAWRLGGAAALAAVALSLHADAASAPTPADAAAFVTETEAEIRRADEESARINWIYATNITFDTEWLVTKANERDTQMRVRHAMEAKRFNGVNAAPEVRRKLEFLKRGLVMPAPQTPGAAAELAQLGTRLNSTYSTGKIEIDRRVVSQNETENLMRELRDPEALAEVWTKWHAVARSMKADYARQVEIANAGARDLGFADVGVMWRSGYDMAPDAFAAEVDRLWLQVKPLYDQLHCHVRAKLNQQYGAAAVPLDQPIRADLLGDMWAQDWGAIADIAGAGSGAQAVDITALLREKKYDAHQIMRQGEAFFTSLGFAPLPRTFWDRSLIVQPADREVVCHASAWSLDSREDIRVKMCTRVDADSFQTAHHELGHNFYQRAYMNQPTLFQGGANDGFHEAIGDMVALSITPEYLQQIGMIDKVPDASRDIDLLMQQALSGVAFLPFGLLVDKWRWQVFAGELTPATYNEGWWKLRTQYQGIRRPVAASTEDFDPGAKFHIPNNTPYMRYFLARLLQFQFYKAACDTIGWTGPLHRCSFYGAKDVGRRLNAMLEMGQSKPWPEALEAFTGTRQMDGAAMVAYFQPLMAWLRKENSGRSCGW